MTRIILAMSAAFVWAGVLLAQTGGGDKKTEAGPLNCPYYPLVKGTSWEYKSAGKVVVAKVADHETLDGVLCARVETEVAGGKVTEHLTVKTEGVYRVRSNNQEIKPPLLVLKFAPNQLMPQKGENWFFECMVQNYSMKGKFTVGEDKVTIGKTTYDTLAVKSSEMSMGNQAINMEVWYAKDIGMVKQHLKLPASDLDVVLELEKFTAGK